MKKILKIGKIIFFVCISMIFLGTGAVFIYHNYQLKMESKLMNNKGELINFNNKKVNVYNEGAGRRRLYLWPDLELPLLCMN